MRLTAAITRERDMYVARCLEVEVASHGSSIEEALSALQEALELYFEDESAAEVPAPAHHCLDRDRCGTRLDSGLTPRDRPRHPLLARGMSTTGASRAAPVLAADDGPVPSLQPAVPTDDVQPCASPAGRG